jgi:hypothetical protein
LETGRQLRSLRTRILDGFAGRLGGRMMAHTIFCWPNAMQSVI